MTFVTLYNLNRYNVWVCKQNKVFFKGYMIEFYMMLDKINNDDIKISLNSFLLVFCHNSSILYEEISILYCILFIKMTILWGIGIVVALLIIYTISLYNKFVNLETGIENATSDIDVQLKRRSDLIPNLIETVKGYANFESSTLEKVIQARNQYINAGSFADKAAADNALSGALKQLFALSESYPDLKANAGFLDLQNQLKELEDVIQNARRFYNASVRDYTVLAKSFPSNIIASIFGFGKKEFFEIAESERAVPKVSF